MHIDEIFYRIAMTLFICATIVAAIALWYLYNTNPAVLAYDIKYYEMRNARATVVLDIIQHELQKRAVEP